MKKRIISFALVLCLLLGILPTATLAADGAAVDVRFGKFMIGIDYIVSAQVSNATVTSVTQLEASAQEGENNRLHYQVELGQYTRNGDVVIVDMAVSQQTSSGIGSALKSELVGYVDSRNDGDDTHYEITMVEGKGQMTCYSYYSNTQYTTLVIDFVVGETGKAYAAPEEVAINDDLVSAFHVWDTDIMKSYCKATDYENAAVYIWLEEDVADDAVIGLQLLFRYTGGFKSGPEGWNSTGGYVQLENGEAQLSFVSKGVHSPMLGSVRTYTVYIKNHMSYAPMCTVEESVNMQTEIGVPINIRLDDYFYDRDGDVLTYQVSVNGETAEDRTNSRYRFTARQTGTTVLTVTASDGILTSEPCEIRIEAVEGHAWGAWETTKAVSCLDDGEQAHTCLSCGATQTQPIPAAGSHTWSNWLVSQKATCLENGRQVRSCTVCGEKEVAAIESGEHDWVVTSTTATCGEDGVEQLRCAACGETKEQTAGKIGEHTWDQWTVTDAASCDEEGTQSRSCTVCGQSEQDVVPMTDHSWDVWYMTTEPTCGEAGEQRRSCRGCGQSETKTIPATGVHNWGVWSVVQEPTDQAEGLRERYCTACGTREQDVVPLQQYAYVTIAIEGELMLVREAVPLEDQNNNGAYDIDDVLIGAHARHGEEEWYRSGGDYIDRLWGVTTMDIGFLCNDAYSNSALEEVSHGDDIYAFVYSDHREWSDRYATFNQKAAQINTGESIELQLKSFAYDESPTPLPNARIMVNGTDSGKLTDSTGRVTLQFDEPGTYYVSATTSAVTITPPVCVISVSGTTTELTPPVLTDAVATTATITVTPPEACAQDPSAVVEYAISNDNKNWSSWQQGNIFDKLTASTEYYVRARYRASDPMKFTDSSASAALSVTTSGGNSAVYTLGDATAAPGETVLIPVSLAADSLQVSRWNVAFQFDKQVFTMNGVTPAQTLADWTVKANLFTKTAYGVPNQVNVREMPTGELLYLSLQVSDQAEAGVYMVTLSETWNVGLKNTFLDENGRYLTVDGRTIAATVTVTEASDVGSQTQTKPTPSTEPAPSSSYTDVQPAAWYVESVDFAVGSELMRGIGANQFAPDQNLTRAQLATLLYRMEGEPNVEAMDNPFADVAKGSWYYNAVVWAADAGVVKGTASDRFAPDEIVTREQLTTMLWRYTGATAAEDAVLTQFADSDDVSNFARDSMAWAVANGLIQGVGEDALQPQGSTTRAQAAAILMRFCENV